MTWEDFLSYIERHYDLNSWDDSPKYVCISSEGNHWVKFYKNGDIAVSDNMNEYDITIAEHRTYEQMIKIIEGLLGCLGKN